MYIQKPVSTWSPIKLILPDERWPSLAGFEGKDLAADLYELEFEGAVDLAADRGALE